jgi:phage terminase large subunit
MKNLGLTLKRKIKILELLSSEEGVKEVVKIYFKADNGTPLILTTYQCKIVQWIVFKYPLRCAGTASTRAGKSLAVSIGLILLSVLRKGEKIRIIAPTTDHTKIVMGYVIQHFLDSEDFSNELMYDLKNLGVEKIKKELTKSKLTLKNSSEIMSITANIAGDGRSLVGFGGTTIVVDEIEQIPSELIRTKVMRMLGDSVNANIFVIGNPVNYGFMYEKMSDPDWFFFKIDCWECVKEGRLSIDFVNEMKSKMTVNEFKIWYEADYPDELEDQLFTQKALKKMFEPLSKQELSLLEKEPDLKQLGVDIARYGNDLSVLYPVFFYGDKKIVLNPLSFSKQDTMKTVGQIINVDSRVKFHNINIDDSGMGGGVTDRLKELNLNSNIVPFVAGEMPFKKKNLNAEELLHNKKYLNKKAFWFRNLSLEAEKGLVRIALCNESNPLFEQLKALKYEYSSNGKFKINDNQEKSPDFADALMMACFIGKPKAIFDF